MSSGSRNFLAQFIRNPQTVGALLPSSQSLARVMLEPITFGTLKTIVEYGPGTGAITQEILPRLTGNQMYFGFEINPNFLQELRHRFPGVSFVGKPASEIIDVLQAEQIDGVDAVVCGLPWASLPISEQSKTLQATARCLNPGGLFITFAYLQGLLLPAAWMLRRRLRENFSTISSTRIVWQNIPPAFAYICVK